MVKGLAGLAAAVLAGLLGGTAYMIWSARAADPYADCRGGAVGGGDIGGAFTLVDETGNTVTDKDVITKPSLVYFGYTFCPDVCPLDNARNAGDAITLATVPTFANRWLIPRLPLLAARQPSGGAAEQVKAASLAYKTYFKKQDSGDEFYLMDHSTFTYLVLPDKGFVDFFQRDDTAEQMAERVGCFLDKG